MILLKPYTLADRADFISKYEYQEHKQIVETDKAIYAIQPWEKVVNDEVIDNSEEYEREQEAKRKEQQRQSILKQLDSLDLKSIRAIRANDEEYIAQYEAQAQELRKQLQEL